MQFSLPVLIILCITVGNLQDYLKPYRIKVEIHTCILSNTYSYLILSIPNGTSHFYLSHVEKFPLALETVPLEAEHIIVR